MGFISLSQWQLIGCFTILTIKQIFIDNDSHFSLFSYASFCTHECVVCACGEWVCHDILYKPLWKRECKGDVDMSGISCTLWEWAQRKPLIGRGESYVWAVSLREEEPAQGIGSKKTFRGGSADTSGDSMDSCPRSASSPSPVLRGFCAHSSRAGCAGFLKTVRDCGPNGTVLITLQ